jgi:hypothetical protein
MQFKLFAAAVAVVGCAGLVQAQSPLLQISAGRVTLHAQNVPVRTILAEWARVGGARIVNGDRVAGAPVTLDLEGVPERQALDIILRGVSGYVVAARELGAPGASMYDRIMILPTSVAPRNPTPAAAPVFQPPGGLRPAAPRQVVEDQNGDDNGDLNANPGGDGVPLARPVPVPTPMPIPRPPGAAPFNPTVMPPIVLPDTNPPQTQQPPNVGATPTNPFGVPAGSSSRPGVITPPAQPVPQGAAPRPQD